MHGDFHYVIRNTKTFFSGAATPTASPTSSPLSTSTPTSTPTSPTSSAPSSAVYVRVASTAQAVATAQERLLEPSSAINWTLTPQKLFDSSSVIDWNSLSVNTPRTVYVQFKINNVWSATKTYTFVKNR